MKHGCTLPFIVAHSVPAPWRIFEKRQESELQEFIRRLFKVDGVSEELQKKQGEKSFHWLEKAKINFNNHLAPIVFASMY